MFDPNKTYKFPFNKVFADVFIEDDTDSKNDDNAGEPIKPREEIISSRPSDPKQELFMKMRQLSREVLKDTFSNERYRERVFYKQAQFMADYEDDYQEIAYFNMYFPNYQMMSYEQLRTYFTWRSRVRSGNVLQADLSYVFLYIYELINNIGCLNGEDGINKLISFWNNYRKYSKKLDKYMAAWIRDYYILNRCPFTFIELLQKEPVLKNFYPINTDRYSMEFYSKISSYRIKESIFYTSENEKIISECFDFIIKRLNELISKSNLKFNDLIFDKSVENRWYPFNNAIFYMKPEYWPHGAKSIEITDEYEYRYKNGKWTYTDSRLYSSNGKHVMGYIFKRMEQFLRKVTKFKYKLSTDDKHIDKRMLDKLLPGIGCKGFLSEIDLAMKQYYINSKKTIVKVDESNLIKIRQNALITQEKLIVPDENGFFDAANPVSELPKVNGSIAIKPVTAALPEECLPDANIAIVQETSAAPYATSEPPDIWNSFVRSLVSVEVMALKKILEGISVKSLYEFAKGSGFMLEVLLDGINQKALDYVGDTILELSDEIIVFDEYIERLGKAVERE